MIKLNVYDAKTQLSRLIDAARRGEEVIIARDNKPMVRLVPIDGPGPSGRRIGSARGQIKIAEDFDAPIPGLEDYQPEDTE
jgi:prevent-host-death family protein